MPAWDAKLYAGDSARGAITRDNPPEPIEVISCNDARIDNYICTSQEDLIELYKLLQKCERWKP